MSRKRTSIIWTLDKDVLKKIVKENDSLSGILRYFGLVKTGAKHKTLKKRLDEDEIDYSHIKLGKHCNQGRRFLQKAIPLKDVMIEHSTYSRGSLKKRMIKEGILENKCSICGQEPFWNGQKLVMIIDHINGVNNDNRLENLRLVCPNCNGQLPTSHGKNRRKVNNCSQCGCVITKHAKLCRSCTPHKRKVANRPSCEQLLKDINETNYVQVGKKYGVSDNAIRKWLKNYES